MDKKSLEYAKEKNVFLQETIKELEEKVKSLENHNKNLIVKFKDQESIIDFLRKENKYLLPLYNCKLPKDKAIYFMSYVCAHYKISIDQVISNSRKGNLPYVRQISCYFLSKHFDWSIYDIRDYLECDRTMVIHNVQRIEDLLEVDRSVLKDVLTHRDWLEKLNKI